MPPKAGASKLDALLASAGKKYDLSVGSMSSISEEAHFISTGNLAIDYAVGGGFPLGRSIELYGKPSSGKTTTSLQAAAELQKIILAGGDPVRGIKPTDRILYLDYEQAMDQDYAKALGLDVDDASFLFTQPDTMENGLDFVAEAVNSGEVRLVIIDSVAAMVPDMVAEASVGKALPAVAAKTMTIFGQKMNPILKRNNATLILLNHAKEQMSFNRPAHLGPLIGTPGGTALKFFASIRLEYNQIGQVKESRKNGLSLETEDAVVATNVSVKVTKNKVAPPFRKVVVQVRYGRGFDNLFNALLVLLAHKVIVYNASRYYFHRMSEEATPEWMAREQSGTKRPFIHGKVALAKAGEDHAEWREYLIQQAIRLINEPEPEHDPDTGEILDDEEAAETTEE